MKDREGFGILSLSCRACDARFNMFVEMKCSFFVASEESFEEVTRMFLAEKHLSDTMVSSVRRWTYVQRSVAELHVFLVSCRSVRRLGVGASDVRGIS